MEKTDVIQTHRDLKTLLKSNQISSDQQINNKSLLHCIVCNLESKELSIGLGRGLNPWCKNDEDGKLPLHAAVERGDHVMCVILMEAMKNSMQQGQNSLKEQSFELLQKAISNQIPIERRGKSINHNLCLEILLNDDTVCGELKDENNVDKKEDLMDYVSRDQNGEPKRILEEKMNLRFLGTNDGNKNISDTIIYIIYFMLYKIK